MGQAKRVARTVWTAEWIDVPGAPKQDYGVYHFRRTFELPVKPEHFEIYVSADNRYQLFVNGQRVSWGPARGDLTHWHYETVDIAAELRAGKNVLAAVVWNDGPYRAVAQMTNETGFVLDADTPEHGMVNTSRAWKCVRDGAYSPQPLAHEQSTGYYALAANERFDASLYPWGWERMDYDDSTWTPAEELTHAAMRDARDAPNRWMLVARTIPMEEQSLLPALKVRRVEGLEGGPPWRVGAGAKATVLLDQAYLTTAYPELEVSGGKGARINLRYAEALFDNREPVKKGNRNEIEGKQFYGPADTYVADGGAHRTYRPLYWRTYRYIQLEIETADQPLTIENLRGVFSAYPFEKKATFDAGNPALEQILETGWHTARLCAHETYMDCPFYEQLQYAGDARIQMLISLYMAGDARLMKNGIGLLNSSRTAEGATYSRAPSYLQQYIPPFSLWWIGMVHDYWMYVDDAEFVKQMMPGVHAVLEFYRGYEKANGSLEHMPWWNFVDWVKPWANGEPPADADGSSAAALDLQLLLAYQWASELEAEFGSKARAGEYRASVERLKRTVRETDWDGVRGLFADQPLHRTYSQQVNTLAVLAHVVEGRQAQVVLEKTIGDASLAQCSIYFRAYLNAALREAGLGDRYVEMLGPWHEMLKEGLTTWAEWNGPDTRSDCHAWGASPNFELLRTVAGIDTMTPGFARVRIAPHLGKLPEVSATMPHPKGTIRVNLKETEEKRIADVELPEGVSGELEWGGKRETLRAGRNHFEIAGRIQ